MTARYGVRWKQLALLLATLCLGLISPAGTQSATIEIAYSYLRGGKGGISVATIDTGTGRIVAQESLYESATCRRPNKLRRTSDRGWLVLTNEDEDRPQLHIVGSADGKARSVPLPGVPDEARVVGTDCLASCDGDWLVMVDIKAAAEKQRWNAEDLFTPPGNGPEDIHIASSGEHVVISFQKDSKKGTKFGNRLAVFAFPSMKLVADLPLKRDHKELHFAGNKQQQGPGPEVVIVARTSDRLLATLDLYGAVLVTDWKAAKEGRLENSKYIPTSADGSWGTAFPDRLVEMYFARQPFVLVCNAGVKGGAVVVGLEKREIVWQRPVPPGLEHPIYFRKLYKAYSVCSGKTKKRKVDDTVKEYHPQPGVFVFDFSSRDAVKLRPVKRVPTDGLMYRIARLPTERPLLVLAGGKDNPDTLLTFDPATEKVLDQKKASGSIEQFEAD